MKEIKQASILFVIGTIGYFLKLILNVFLAHHLSTQNFGDYNVAIAFLRIFIELSLFGTTFGIPLFFAKYLQLNKQTKAAEYVAWNLRLVRSSPKFAVNSHLFSPSS